MTQETQAARLEQPDGSIKQTDIDDLHLHYSVNPQSTQADYVRQLAATMMGGTVHDNFPEPWASIHNDAQTAIAGGAFPIAAYEQAVRKHCNGQADAIWIAIAKTIKEDDQSETPAPANPWHFYTLADAYQSREPLRYAVESLFALPSLNIVYGPPGSLKSFVVADAAICVAAGQNWLSPLPNRPDLSFRVTQGPAIWVDFDNGVRRTHERFDALGTARRLPTSTPLSYVSMPDPWLEANKADHVDAFIERVLAQHAIMVVIDNLGTVSGGLDENSPQMIQVMSNLRRLAEGTGAAVVVIHHQRKGNDSVGARKGDSLRGHSSIEAALDLALRIEREEESPIVTAVPTKVRGPEIQPFGAYFTYEHRAGTQDLSTARFWSYEVEVPGSYRQIKAALAEHLLGGPQPKTKLIKDVAASLEGVSQKKVRDLLEQLIQKGELCENEVQADRTRTKQISLPDDTTV